MSEVVYRCARIKCDYHGKKETFVGDNLVCPKCQKGEGFDMHDGGWPCKKPCNQKDLRLRCLDCRLFGDGIPIRGEAEPAKEFIERCDKYIDSCNKITEYHYKAAERNMKIALVFIGLSAVLNIIAIMIKLLHYYMY